MNIRDLIFSAGVTALREALKAQPSLANEEIPLPDNAATAHPLHRICDGVFNGYYSEETGLELANLFLAYGANVNSPVAEGKDSPLTAACSLRCDKLALLYMHHQARTDHKGCYGGTPLHWAAWCGRDTLVRKLVTMTPNINQKCIEFKSTPLFWTIHGYKFGGSENRHHQVDCARVLLDHGADPSIPNFEGYLPVQLLDIQDKELLTLFNKA